MAWLKASLAAAIALATTTAASPVLQDRADGVELFRFRVLSEKSQVDQKFLTYGSGGIGVYPNATNVTVYGIQSLDSSNMTELHTYPIGIVDHVLALAGVEGLLTLKDEVAIGGSVSAEGNDTIVDADNFQIIHGMLSYLGEPSGGWVVYPQAEGYVLSWYDGGITTEDYLPVSVEVVAAGKGSYGG